MGKYQEAIAACTEAVRLEPAFLGPYKTRADAYRRIGLKQESEADLDHLAQVEKARLCSLGIVQLMGRVDEKWILSGDDTPNQGNWGMGLIFGYYINVDGREDEVSKSLYDSVSVGDQVLITFYSKSKKLVSIKRTRR